MPRRLDRVVVSLLVLLVVALAAPPAAQEQAPPRAVFRSGVELVRLDVRVTGPDGTPVADLRPDEIVITSGCLEAVGLALRALCKPGDTVAVESPAYFSFLQLIESLGLRVLEIPATPAHGMSLDVLRYALVEVV